jgi:Flp pilus assembly pilin Flp
MKNSAKEIKATKNNEKGLSLLEYAIGAAVLSGIVVIAMTTFGTGVKGYFSKMGSFVSSMTVGS